jgi:plasmid stabilization system protein ParE
MNVRVLPMANLEAVDATAYLELRRSGLGDDFYADFQQAIAAIGENPRMYPRTEDGPDEPENREYFIARFKYRVIYAIWKEEAVIVAVLHASRQPGVWRGRLTEITTEE